ncbi:MAG: septation regulator SpoVG [Clostridia bacterium]|nr:septation regulator SpoVG [Clostridia bacterium]
MRITDVKIRKLTRENRLRAVMSVTFDGELAVHDIKIIEGDGRLFVAMPSRRNGEGVFKDIAHPINRETRQYISDTLISEYKRACESESGHTV